ncbi:hypothetical protein C2845_PM03G14410 [Panicum miliaceum]|uniref:Uncharacterized protein n=1 Tax=Panicum miliaceum TaxID=4540 RepID=A0A3L6T9P6_PANMI|nr:hypothetical protein C2845_PM03G14410 [Panicum miliaceum]
MAEPTLLAPDPFADLPFTEFQAPVDGDNFAFEDFDLEDLDLDVDFDLDLFASDGQLLQPPPLATSSSSAGSPEGGSSSSGGLRNEESSESCSRSASGTDGSVNLMYGSVDGGEGSSFGPSHHGRVLSVEGPCDSVSDSIDPKPPQSTSETLPALLYLPKKHVKINGNLVIKSIVASEKASLRMSGYDGKSPRNQGKEETSLAIPGYVAPLEAGEVMESTTGMKNKLMALAPADGNMYREDDGLLPQWFSEAMSGPLLSSGMCTEVFQFDVFDVSPSSAHANGIVPVYSNAMSNSTQNFTENLPSARPHTVKNRRISYSEAIPLKGSTSNNTERLKTPPTNESFGSMKPVSPVVVSVLADPREAGDGNGEGRISSKSLSRIFVVVLIDSVKYVTYSCVLPFKNHSPHL